MKINCPVPLFPQTPRRAQELALIALLLQIDTVMASSVDPDQMQQNVASALGLHCLPKSFF